MEILREETRNYRDAGGRKHSVRYCLYREGNNYGLSVEDGMGYEDRVRDVTTRREWGEELFALLHRNLVTPVTLRDVLEDLL